MTDICKTVFSSLNLLHLFLCLDLSELPDLAWKNFLVEEEFKVEVTFRHNCEISAPIQL